jgi:hypothetical protein
MGSNASYLRSQHPLFPPGFSALYRYLTEYHRATAWQDRLRISCHHLPTLLELQEDVFHVVLPLLLHFFKASSHTEGINLVQVCAATVYILPRLTARVKAVRLRQALLDDMIRLYESTALTPVLKLVLCSPEVARTLGAAFGLLALLQHFLPVLVEWTTTPSVYQRSTIGSAPHGPATSRQPTVLFAVELASLLAVSCGEIASTDVLGPSLAVKYVLPVLLQRLGKILPKWSRSLRGEPQTTGHSASYEGIHSHGFHVAFAPKHALYQPHSVADAILLVCRELPSSAVSTTVLSYLCDVIPRLIEVAEGLSATQLAGVPVRTMRYLSIHVRG